MRRLELPLEHGEVLRYGLRLPEFSPDEKVPLVLALHYGGPVTPYLGAQFMELLVTPAYEGLGAIIVAPDCPGRGWTDPKSERAVLALLDHVAARWPVDSERTVVTGFSLGGIGSWFLARRHADRFSAAVPVAGSPAGEPGGRVPVFAIHGKQDEVIDIGPTRKAIDLLREEGVEARLRVIRGLTHYETQRYVIPLKRTVPWLREVWERQRRSP